MNGPDWMQGLRAQLPLEAAAYRRLHLAVFSEPFLSDLLAGRKTMESRFSKHRIAPYGRVQEGDGVLVKAAGGDVVAVCRIGKSHFFELNETVLRDIRQRYERPLCIKNARFWQEKTSSRYATVMEVGSVRPIEPIACAKRDRRGWVTLSGAS